MKRSFVIFGVCLALAGMLAGPVLATTVQPLTTSELVSRSTKIIHGIVQDAHSQYDGTEIYTYVTLQATEWLKGIGAVGASVTFRQLGGQVGDTVSYVPGTPRFSPKQEVLVFLTAKDSAGFPEVMGIFQGAFRPVSGPSGNRRVEPMSPEALSTLSPDKPQPGPVVTPTSPVVGGSFEGFLQSIREIVKQQAGKQ